MNLQFLEKLDTRERLFIIGFGVFLVLLLFAMGANTFYSSRQELSDDVQSSSDILQRLQRLRSQIMSLAPAQKLPDNAQVFSQINTTLNTYQLSPTSINEKKKKAKQSFAVSIRLQSVPMQNLLNFLYDIEYNSNLPLSVSSFQLRRSISKKDLYDVNFTVSLGGG